MSPFRKITALIVCLTGFVIIFEIILFCNRPNRTKSLEAFHPFLQIQPMPKDPKTNTNQWGFRGEEITKKKPEGVYRIFVVGGSTVFCDRVAFEDSHVRILEKKLRNAYPENDIQVQNVGMHWHTTLHSLIKIATILPEFNPDLIILYHAINDLSRSFPNKRFTFRPYQSDYSHYFGPLSGIINAYLSQDFPVNLALLRVVRQKYFSHLSRCWFSDIRRPKKFEEYPNTSWKSIPSFERNLRNIVQIAKAMNIDLILASQPFLFRKDLTNADKEKLIMWNHMLSENRKKPTMESMAMGMNRYNGISRTIAEEHGVPFCDLETRVPKTFEYFLDGVHYTAAGNRIIGESLAEFVINQKMHQS